MSQLGEAFVPIRATMDKLDGDLEKARGMIDGAIGNLQTLGKVSLAGLAGGLGAVVGGIGAVLTSSAGMAMDMEAQMANIASAMGVASDATSTWQEKLTPIKDLINDLGVDPNLKVSAVEAAQAIEMLVRNGLTMDQILAGAARSTVLLANSTGADFAMAANIATDAMAIFGITAEDMTTAVDGITSVTIASKFGIEDYALALAQGGGVASAAGVEFDDFNTAIAAISPLFAGGSDAGTAFKTMLTRLIPGSSDAAEAMSELGIIGLNTAEAMQFLTNQGFAPVTDSAGDIMSAAVDWGTSVGYMEDEIGEVLQSLGLMGNQFFDAEGNLRSMAEIAGVLETSMADLSEQQRTQALSTIFGSDAMRAAVGLMRTGEDQFNALAETMGQTSAIDQAATRMDNLAGVVEIFEGIIESVKIQLGTALLPVLRQFAERAVELGEQVAPLIIGAFEGVVTILDGLVSIFFQLIDTGDSLFVVFEDGSTILESVFELFGMGEEQARGLAMQVIEIAGQVQAFIEQVMQVLEPIAEAIASFVSWQDVLAALGIAIASFVIPAIIAIVQAVAPVILVFAAVTAAVALLRNAWENNWGGIQEKVQAVINFVVPLVQNAIAGIRNWWAANGDQVLAKAREIWNAVQTAVSTVINVISTVISRALSNIQSWWAANGSNVISAVRNAWNTIQSAISTVISVVQNLINSALTAIQNWWQEHGNSVMTIVNAFLSFVRNLFQSETDNARSVIQNALNWIRDFWNTHGATIMRIVGDMWNAIKNEIQSALDFIGGIVDAFALLVEGDWRGFLTTLWDTVVDRFEAIVETIRLATDGIRDVIAGLIQDVIDFFRNTDWGDLGWRIINGILNGLINAQNMILDWLTNLATQIWQGIIGLFSGDSAPAGAFSSPGFGAAGVLDLDQLVEGATVNNYNLTLHTNETSAGVANDFYLMQAVNP